MISSRLCLGTMNFGWTGRAVAHAIMHLAHERGTNFFDTAMEGQWIGWSMA